MLQIVVVYVIVKGAHIHLLLGYRKDIVELGVMNILKYNLEISDDLVYVTWFLSMI